MSKDLMSPDQSPSDFTNAGKTNVRRVNNKPLLIGLGIALAFALMIVYVANKRSNQNLPTEAEARTSKSSMNAVDSLLAEAPTGTIAPRSNLPTVDSFVIEPFAPTESSESVANAIAEPSIYEAPTSPSIPEPSPYEQERERLKMLALYATSEIDDVDILKDGERQEMLNQIQTSQAAASRALVSANPTDVFNAKLAKIQGQINSGGGIGANSSSGMQFGSNSTMQPNNGNWNIDANPEAPKTPYTIRTGHVIPATLIGGINSELPGQIIGQVSQNVYDSALGKFLLIPQGSRLIGTYESAVQYGQSRVFVAWQRIIYPDGKALDIGQMPGADAAGYSGFNDKVNNHYFRIFGTAVMLSGITAGISYSQDPNGRSGDRETASDMLSQSMGQVLGTAVANMLQKNINIAPTLEIRPGYQFNVTVVKDLTFQRPFAVY